MMFQKATSDNVSLQTENIVLQKAGDLDRLVDLMKEKLNNKSFKKLKS